VHIGIEYSHNKITIATYSQSNIAIIGEEPLPATSSEALNRLLAEYLAGLKGDSLAINIPSDWGLKQKNQLYSFLQSYTRNISIIPTPLAALVGYLKQGLNISGDSLWIKEMPDPAYYEMALVNYLPAYREIILESFFTGGEEELTQEALRLGIYHKNKWKLQHLFWAGSNKKAPGPLFNKLTVSGIPGIEVKEVFPAIPSEVLTGLCSWNQIRQEMALNLKIIYPHRFYRQVTNTLNGSEEWHKIPFDTANIELDLFGRYKLCSFSPEDSLRADSFPHLTIGESNSDKDILPGAEPSMDIIPVNLNCGQQFFKSAFDLYWDVNSGTLELQPSQWPAGPGRKKAAKLWGEIRQHYARQKAFMDMMPEISKQTENECVGVLDDINEEKVLEDKDLMDYLEKKLKVMQHLLDN